MVAPYAPSRYDGSLTVSKELIQTWRKRMRNLWLKAIVVSLVFLLSSCHTTTGPTTTNLFNLSPPPAAPNLTQSVQDALARSGDPMIGQVRVQTMQSTVVLSGYVKKIRQSDMAELMARKVPGVQQVVNRIIVRP